MVGINMSNGCAWEVRNSVYRTDLAYFLAIKKRNKYKGWIPEEMGRQSTRFHAKRWPGVPQGNPSEGEVDLQQVPLKGVCPNRGFVERQVNTG